jgi:hypothetical protein
MRARAFPGHGAELRTQSRYVERSPARVVRLATYGSLLSRWAGSTDAAVASAGVLLVGRLDWAGGPPTVGDLAVLAGPLLNRRGPLAIGCWALGHLWIPPERRRLPVGRVEATK